MEVDVLTVITDKGYYSAYPFAQCEDDGITPIVSKADRSFLTVTEAYSKEAFQYDNEREGYICPEGHFLKPYRMRATSKFAGHILYENKAACMSCGVRNLCTNGKTRTVNDRPYEDYARAVDKRTRENKEMYQQRKQLVEHPWGTVKRSWCYSYFLTRRTKCEDGIIAAFFGVQHETGDQCNGSAGIKSRVAGIMPLLIFISLMFAHVS